MQSHYPPEEYGAWYLTLPCPLLLALILILTVKKATTLAVAFFLSVLISANPWLKVP